MSETFLDKFYRLLETNPEAKEMYLREKKKLDDKYRKIIEQREEKTQKKSY